MEKNVKYLFFKNFTYAGKNQKNQKKKKSATLPLFFLAGSLDRLQSYLSGIALAVFSSEGNGKAFELIEK